MRETLVVLWQKIVNWLSVLGSAHVVDDGIGEKNDRPQNRPPTKLRLITRQG